MPIYLDVPYDDRAEVKALGAHWSYTIKKWYCEHHNSEKFREWIPPPPEFRVILNIPYSAKDEAKKLGAKWDREDKVWYTWEERLYRFRSLLDRL